MYMNFASSQIKLIDKNIYLNPQYQIVRVHTLLQQFVNIFHESFNSFIHHVDNLQGHKAIVMMMIIFIAITFICITKVIYKSISFDFQIKDWMEFLYKVKSIHFVVAILRCIPSFECRK